MRTLFVQGPRKTATSTITGILNCHPGIFILFENYVADPEITKYANLFFERYPEARHFFRTEEDYGKPIKDIFSFLKKKEPDYNYQYCGTKINSFDPFITQKVSNHKVIFMMRNIKSWLVKESIVNVYRTDLDIVTPATDYLRYIINVHKVPGSYRLWMEDLIEYNDKSIDQISGYLDLPLKPYTKQWWKKIANWDKENPKSVFKLNRVHHSSRVPPTKLDTSCEVADHPFWEKVDDIFSKYYRVKNSEVFTRETLNSDLRSVNELREFAPLSIENSYREIESVRFGYKNKERAFNENKNDLSNKINIKRKLISALRLARSSLKGEFNT
jgi:hypothetical protein